MMALVMATATAAMFCAQRIAQVESYSNTTQALAIYSVVDGSVVTRDTYW